MKKMIIAIVCALLVLVLGVIGVKTFLLSGDKDSATDVPNIPITNTTTDQPAVDPVVPENPTVPAVTPTAPNSDEPIKLYDNGVASFNYDSTKLIFDEIPPSEENGVPMVSFMLADSENALPRVDAMPLKVSATGDGEENFYNISEDVWQQLAAEAVRQYYSPASKAAAQISFSGTVVKPESTTSMKMFTNISVTIPSDIAAQTGDFSMNGSIRLVASGEQAMITMAMYGQNSSLPEELKDVYMSMQLH